MFCRSVIRVYAISVPIIQHSIKIEIRERRTNPERSIEPPRVFYFVTLRSSAVIICLVVVFVVVFYRISAERVLWERRYYGYHERIARSAPSKLVVVKLFDRLDARELP